jgi:hypothetical protein
MAVTSYVGGRTTGGDLVYGRLRLDAYGDRYTWIRAGRLVPVLRRFLPRAPDTAYVMAMPEDDLIILDWH